MSPTQNESLDAAIVTNGVTEVAFTLMTLLVTVEVVLQLALEVIIRLTWSPLASVLDVNVEAFVPAFTPLICH
jgi:hypothetical protein